MQQPKFDVGDIVFAYFCRDDGNITFIKTIISSLVYVATKDGVKFEGYRTEILSGISASVKPKAVFATLEEASEAFIKDLAKKEDVQ